MRPTGDVSGRSARLGSNSERGSASGTAIDVPLSPASLSVVGLSGTPTATSLIGIFWNGSVEGVREVSMFGPAGGKVSYIYVRAFTD